MKLHFKIKPFQLRTLILHKSRLWISLVDYWFATRVFLRNGLVMLENLFWIGATLVRNLPKHRCTGMMIALFSYPWRDMTPQTSSTLLIIYLPPMVVGQAQSGPGPSEEKMKTLLVEIYLASKINSIICDCISVLRPRLQWTRQFGSSVTNTIRVTDSLVEVWDAIPQQCVTSTLTAAVDECASPTWYSPPMLERNICWTEVYGKIIFHSKDLVNSFKYNLCQTKKCFVNRLRFNIKWTYQTSSTKIIVGGSVMVWASFWWKH